MRSSYREFELQRVIIETLQKGLKHPFDLGRLELHRFEL